MCYGVDFPIALILLVNVNMIFLKIRKRYFDLEARLLVDITIKVSFNFLMKKKIYSKDVINIQGNNYSYHSCGYTCYLVSG